ncbi:MAG: hypothetical protein LBC04_01715 [Holosporaceae bacterium]|jgi:GDP-D-mannose dehydratase|nr:hypothetical protein [Holosporaceae bacterium]
MILFFSSFKLHSLEDIIKICSKVLNIPDWRKHIDVDESIIGRKIRSQLLGDNSKAMHVLEWKQSLNFEELVELMINEES